MLAVTDCTCDANVELNTKQKRDVDIDKNNLGGK